MSSKSGGKDTVSAVSPCCSATPAAAPSHPQNPRGTEGILSPTHCSCLCRGLTPCLAPPQFITPESTNTKAVKQAQREHSKFSLPEILKRFDLLRMSAQNSSLEQTAPKLLCKFCCYILKLLWLCCYRACPSRSLHWREYCVKAPLDNNHSKNQVALGSRCRWNRKQAVEDKGSP